ncbi:MAG TPA: hypothetical protein VFE53_02350, partial [Mucilaginibacter sp.]|nr:hypothetical protein [Mucilaginibacter sp.]
MEQPNQNQNNNSNIHQALGVISLIVGILGFILSFIPCFGVYAIYLGVPGLGCGIAAIIMARKVNAAIGLATAGLVMSFLATVVSS